MTTPQLNVLAVDDQPENLLALDAVLGDLCYRLVKAGSGREALRCLLEEDFALILLDIQMPEMDGFETAQLIRARNHSRATPIIFLTAAIRTEEMVFKGYASGAVDYMTKPIVPEILRAKVQIFMELAAARLTLEKEIAERHRAEREIKILNEDLKGRAMQIEAANNELEAFSYSVSHDLRAPLRHIDGFVGLLQKRSAAALDEQSRSYLDSVADAAKQMAQLIDDLLSFARMGRAEMRSARVNLDKLVQDTLHDLRQETEGRDIVWKVGPLPEVQADPAMLRQTLVNLISNALKYSRGRASAQIEIGCQPEQSGEYVFFVRDNGVGFDMQFADKLFGVFQRLHRAEDFEGTGIGLANVRRIIARHGGRTWAEGKAGEGATFYFSLPQSQKEQL